jgi:hypothetical protein
VTAYGDETIKFYDRTAAGFVTVSKLDDNQRDFIDYYPGSSDRDKLVIYTGLSFNDLNDNSVIDFGEKLAGLGLQNTGLTNGKLVIEGLILLAQDWAPYDQDVTFTIRSATDDEIARFGIHSSVSASYVGR